jgi:phosphatidylserine/phosphatidylglycerophosphate/cardiolipin synthase-like enzyme
MDYCKVKDIFFKARHDLYILTLAIAVLAISAGCRSKSSELTTIAEKATPSAAVLGDWISIYFTKPEESGSKSLRGGPDQLLADAINQAHVSVDIAVQQLDLWSIRDALINAHRRGVKVRMVTESDYIDEKEVQQLIAAGIPVIGDRRQGLMHNKFTIIDRSEVWIGSMNYTVSEGYRNNNTLIRNMSPSLAENYLAEFEEMFTNDAFGPGSPAETPKPSIRINQTVIETCFSPEDGCTAKLERAINSAKESIYFLAFSFTSDELADALIDCSKRGLAVQGVMETDQALSNRGTDYNRFINDGLDIRLDGNPDQMHHKVIIIDQKIVATGSFNFTYSAETANDENILFYHDPEVAKIFLEEYQRVFNRAVK